MKVQMKFQDGPEHVRKTAIYLSHRYSGLSLKEIGKYFGIKESAVSQSSRRFETALSENIRIRKKVMRLKEELNLCNV